MGLRFILGGSGSGKSTYIFQKFIDEAKSNPKKNFFVMVPDQFTMSSQKQLCKMSPSGGIMNIDVQSFSRLIHRISDELGTKRGAILDDTGKNLILRRVAGLYEEELNFLGTKLRRPGYVHEVKSMLSELYQYDISVADLNEMIEASEGKGLLSVKLQDLRTLYIGFKEYIKDKFITSEEALDELCRAIPRSNLLKGSDIVFDGFTGFTPIQIRVILELMSVAENIYITLNADSQADLQDLSQQKLFALSAHTYQKLVRGAKELNIPVEDSIFLPSSPVKRHAMNKELAFLESSLFRYKKETYDEVIETIGVFEADSLINEIQHVCQNIKAMIRTEGLYYRDIAVVSGDLSRYEHIIRTEFARYHIPYFMDQNRSVSSNPLAEYMVSALSIIKNRFSYESVFRFLRCGLTSLTFDETDRLDNYITSLGIRGKKNYTNPFTRGKKAEEMENVRQKLIQELSPIMTKCKTAKEYITCLYDLCVQNNLQKKCENYAEQFTQKGDLAKAKEYEKIYIACMDLLNQIYELIGDDELKLEEFIQILEAGISEIRIGTIPQSADQVLIGDIERSRLNDIKIMFFIGVNDGVIPGKGASGGLLSDMEREFLKESGRELAPTPRQKIFQQRLYLYQNMSKPTQKLLLSYSKTNGNGDAILPAYLIRTVLGLYPKLSVQNDTLEKNAINRIETMEDGLDDLADLLRCFVGGEVQAGSKEEEELKCQLSVLAKAYDKSAQYEHMKQAAFYRRDTDKLSKALADLLYQDHKSASISRVEKYASCAFAHFLQYGLGLKEKQEYEFQAIDFGTVYHSVLENLMKKLKQEGTSLKNITDEDIEKMVEEILNQISQEYGETILHSSARNEYRISQMKKVLLKSLNTMRFHLEQGEFNPAYIERSFKLDGPISVVGKIDRIDVCRQDDKTYVKVIDYKSSERKFDENELYYGLKLQLPLYMHAALQMLEEQYPKDTLVPAAMLYYHLNEPEIKEEELSKAGLAAARALLFGGQEETKSEVLEETLNSDLEDATHKVMRLTGLTVESDEVIQKIDRDFSTKSSVVKVAKTKEGEYQRYSQSCDKELFDLYLKYADFKTKDLMSEALAGNIATNPVMIDGDKTDSCTYCPYQTVCKRDPHIPGTQVKELEKIEEVKEAMTNAINAGSK